MSLKLLLLNHTGIKKKKKRINTGADVVYSQNAKKLFQ